MAGYFNSCDSLLNGATRMLLVNLNNCPIRRLGVSRRQLFDELDRPALAALPTGALKDVKFFRLL